MQFDDTTNLQGLKQGIHFECDTSDQDYPEADMIRNLNFAVNYFSLFMQNAGGSVTWQGQTLNNALGVTTGVMDYTLPFDYLQIERIELLGANSERTRLDFLDKQLIQGAVEDYSDPSVTTPLKYDLKGKQLSILPKPGYTLANSIEVTYYPLPTLFTGSDTDTTPTKATLDEFFILYASIKYNEKNHPDRVDLQQLRMAELLSMAKMNQTTSLRGRKGQITPSYIDSV